MASSFAAQEYWNARFAKDDSTFDWLIPASALCDVAEEYTDIGDRKDAEILHIGCGTSDSASLRRLVDNAAQILNVDFSQHAIDACTAREQKQLEQEKALLLADDAGGQTSPVFNWLPNRMSWSCLDVLTLDSIFSILEQQARVGRLFDLVLDKSTSDSISCGARRELQLPYPLSIGGWTRQILQTGIRHPASIHPMHILAVHLAALTAPGSGRWIIISYSEDRLPFFPPYPSTVENGLLTDDVITAGFPHPDRLWRLEKKEFVDPDAHRDETLAERKKRLAAGPARRTSMKYWLYVLVRTTAIVTD